MAWVDDRIWCHPKFTDLPPAAAWLWVCGTAYCSGFHTRGRLTSGQIKQIGGATRTRRLLIEAGLWADAGAGAVLVVGWDEHNGARDERRERDRERKKRAYWAQKSSRGFSAENGPENGAESRALTDDCMTDDKVKPLRAVLDGSETGRFEPPPGLLKDMPA